LKWEGIGTKNLFPHTSNWNVTSQRKKRVLESARAIQTRATADHVM